MEAVSPQTTFVMTTLTVATPAMRPTAQPRPSPTSSTLTSCPPGAPTQPGSSARVSKSAVATTLARTRAECAVQTAADIRA